LQERSGAPVYMLEGEIYHSREVWNNPDHASFAGHLVRGGMDRALAERAAAQMRAKLSLPGEVLPLQEGEKIELGAGAARVLHAPGHADYQVMLYDEGRKMLFSADHVMLEIAPGTEVRIDEGSLDEVAGAAAEERYQAQVGAQRGGRR
jgi:glyoxylase-like metal-dependent hydrolase (beta-lactamase superfamily II)